MNNIISFLLGCGFVVSLAMIALAIGSNWSDERKARMMRRKGDEILSREAAEKRRNHDKLAEPIEWSSPMYDYLDPSKIEVKHVPSVEICTKA